MVEGVPERCPTTFCEVKLLDGGLTGQCRSVLRTKWFVNISDCSAFFVSMAAAVVGEEMRICRSSTSCLDRGKQLQEMFANEPIHQVIARITRLPFQTPKLTAPTEPQLPQLR